ncbi:sodium-independent anion transporter [Kordiimonas sediminis]|uniref:Sodium-independent anion transporter n=1 Tax=Kordiimonas sediminis TaxID=1735581 RepID=A0A919ANM1_9PROT|nr:sulfate permease [Kordiimonas sediminis]GHF17401.1 sodium-independent anion transporter [Kordiimonas sediminis]
MKLLRSIESAFPIIEWGRTYSKQMFAEDGVAAVIVTIMLIPQSLAYAMLAGLPPEVGLYASILPLILYAVFGTSRTLAVGPVAVVSLMTATATAAIAAPGTIGYLETAIALAFLSGLFLLFMGVFRLGFIANFLSHPVISGFITASGLLIAFSQLKHILGVQTTGHTLPEQTVSMVSQLDLVNIPTVIIGSASIVLLFSIRNYMKAALIKAGLGARAADLVVKAGPIMVVVLTTVSTYFFGLADKGVTIVGAVPTGLPGLSVPGISFDLAADLAAAALLISLIGFVESVSVAQTLAAKRRQRIRPNQELVALGASNIASAVSGGYPVTGGFARSVVNFDAGAVTPAAGALTAIGIALATLFLTPLLYFLPKATLAATIIIAVLTLVKVEPIIATWRYSKRDFSAMAATILLTLLVGVEAGIAAGVILSFVLFMHRTTIPHFAIVGLVPGTEHFRNVLRHDVETADNLLTIRIDESLYFANMRFLEDKIYDLALGCPKIRHVVLMCPAVNNIDASALEGLEAMNHRLQDAGITMHLSEVKGPVMDRLQTTSFLDDLTGDVFLSQYQAWKMLANPAK